MIIDRYCHDKEELVISVNEVLMNWDGRSRLTMTITPESFEGYSVIIATTDSWVGGVEEISTFLKQL